MKQIEMVTGFDRRQIQHLCFEMLLQYNRLRIRLFNDLLQSEIKYRTGIESEEFVGTIGENLVKLNHQVGHFFLQQPLEFLLLQHKTAAETSSHEQELTRSEHTSAVFSSPLSSIISETYWHLTILTYTYEQKRSEKTLLKWNLEN